MEEGPPLFPTHTLAKGVKGRKEKGLGLWMLSEARPMGTIGQESTHFFIGLSAVETFNNFAQSYKIFNDCNFCYTPVI